MADFMHECYPNEVVANKFESILKTKVSLSPFITLDSSLEGAAGMKKEIVKYLPVGEVEQLSNREGNSSEWESTYTESEYEVKVYQAKTSVSDEEYMTDPNILQNVLNGEAEGMVNTFNAQAIAEMGKATQTIEIDFTTSTAGYLFGKIVDAIALFEEGVDDLWILVNTSFNILSNCLSCCCNKVCI